MDIEPMLTFDFRHEGALHVEYSCDSCDSLDRPPPPVDSGGGVLGFDCAPPGPPPPLSSMDMDMGVGAGTGQQQKEQKQKQKGEREQNASPEPKKRKGNQNEPLETNEMKRKGKRKWKQDETPGAGEAKDFTFPRDLFDGGHLNKKLEEVFWPEEPHPRCVKTNAAYRPRTGNRQCTPPPLLGVWPLLPASARARPARPNRLGPPVRSPTRPSTRPAAHSSTSPNPILRRSNIREVMYKDKLVEMVSKEALGCWSKLCDLFIRHVTCAAEAKCLKRAAGKCTKNTVQVSHEPCAFPGFPPDLPRGSPPPSRLYRFASPPSLLSSPHPYQGPRHHRRDQRPG